MNREFVKIKEFRRCSDGSRNLISYQYPKEHAVFVKGQWMRKIDAILEAFGHGEWLDVLRDTLGLKKEDGIQGINGFMANSEMVAKYRALVTHYAEMAAANLETSPLEPVQYREP